MNSLTRNLKEIQDVYVPGPARPERLAAYKSAVEDFLTQKAADGWLTPGVSVDGTPIKAWEFRVGRTTDSAQRVPSFAKLVPTGEFIVGDLDIIARAAEIEV